ncbi:MAG: hypothetical protein K2H43_01470, partial [Clostridia bacterium]|nr:hypothetical protein [Clostridia bacterium]
EVTPRAVGYLADNGYDGVYGARPLNRFIQSRAETMIAKHIVRNNPAAGSTITLDCNEGGLYLK